MKGMDIAGKTMFYRARLVRVLFLALLISKSLISLLADHLNGFLFYYMSLVCSSLRIN